MLTTALSPPFVDVKEPPVTVIWSSCVVPSATAPIVRFLAPTLLTFDLRSRTPLVASSRPALVILLIDGIDGEVPNIASMVPAVSFFNVISPTPSFASPLICALDVVQQVTGRRADDYLSVGGMRAICVLQRHGPPPVIATVPDTSNSALALADEVPVTLSTPASTIVPLRVSVSLPPTDNCASAAMVTAATTPFSVPLPSNVDVPPGRLRDGTTAYCHDVEFDFPAIPRDRATGIRYIRTHIHRRPGRRLQQAGLVIAFAPVLIISEPPPLVALTTLPDLSLE